MQENTKHIEYDYKINNFVLVYYKNNHNYEAPYKVPHKITQIWTSRTEILCMVSVQDRV